MLEKLTQYIDSACKRTVDVAAYLQKIIIFFIELTKVGASADVFHSRTLSRVLGKISDGRHIGADHLDCKTPQNSFCLCLLWRRIHTTATSVRNIYSVAVPEINLSKLEQVAQRLTRCVSESRPS